MKKLTLSLDELSIESFTTSNGEALRGTVQGLDTTNYGAMTCNGYNAGTCIGHATCFTCYYTQCGSCDGVCTQDTCNTCNDTCDQNNATACGPCYPNYPGEGGPVWSSGWTACGNCQQSVNEVGTCILPCGFP